VQRLLRPERGLTRPCGCQRVVHVEDADDLGAQRYRIAHETVGIAAAVVALVMRPDDGLQVPRELDVGQQLDAPHGMHFDHRALLRRERAGFMQNFVGDTHHAHVVEVGAQEHGALLGVVQAERLRDGDHVLGHALAVTEREAVARFDRLAPFAHHGQIGALEHRQLSAHVHQVDPGVQPPEQLVRGGEHAQRVVVAAHRLV